MNVAVEATRLRREVRGIGRYVRALLPRLLDLRSDLQLSLFVRDADVDASIGALSLDTRAHGRATVRSIRTLDTADADIFWYPWNVAIPRPGNGAVVVTIHDVAQVALPDQRISGWYKNWRWRRRFGLTARRATLVLADSAFTADEVHRVLRIPRERLRVVHLAAGDFTTSSTTGDPGVLDRLKVRPPYILSVGAGDARKNIGQLLEAMPIVHAERPDLGLVLAGPRRSTSAGGDGAPWQCTLGFVADADLAVLYRNATAFVMTSLYEGFGLPVLEAMQVGTPAICVRASSVIEVGGDAAVWVQPHDVQGLARAITRVASDPAERNTLGAAGRAQAGRFSWDTTARLTLKAFEEARASYQGGSPSSSGERT